MDKPDDRWRDVATRLISDSALLDRGIERDFFGQLGPSKQTGAYVLEAGRLVITRLEKLVERLDTLYGDQLNAATRQRLRTAHQQLRAAAEALTRLPEELHPNYRSLRVRDPGPVVDKRIYDSSCRATRCRGQRHGSEATTWDGE